MKGTGKERDMSCTGWAKDTFDFVISDRYIYGLPDAPDRWPDTGNGASEEPDDPPPTIEVPVNEYFIATQRTVSAWTVDDYVTALNGGADMPPVAAIKCTDGIIVWNGHHRLSAHRLAGKETIKVRIWAEIDQSVKDWEDHNANL
jgi:hypothetical protein